MEIKHLTTETRNERTMELDKMTALEIVTAMNAEDKGIPVAIEEELPSIAKAVDLIVDAFNNGGRLFYIGAGTSGRLAVLDASECPPTFGVGYDMVIGIIAGGDSALRFPSEGAEDSFDLSVEDLKKYEFSNRDVLVGLAASGRTPYVIGGLRYAHELGAKTICITCNKNSLVGKESDVAIEVKVGPEVLTGSTRLKAGTAQKLVLNMLSTGSMVRMGKAYQNLMVDVQQSNEKLVKRARNIVMQATGVDEAEAIEKLQLANGSCKLAIVMILKDCSAEVGEDLLRRAHGHVREAIQL